ncbi:MAG: tripartite tricarboxylate transporter substrate binding protein [Acetobacteraceae bacterium]|nr:tripartite tricarboxylate transporter substrate binding protein [Acetobacteraceae bacterium]
MPLRRRALLAAPLTLTAIPARAQGGFPDRPIRVVIGYPPGGGVDTVGRPILQRVQELLGQPVVVENRAGANGNIAMEHVARAEPDGHVIFLGDAGNLAITHALYPALPFDTQRDFAGVAQLTAGPVVLVVPAALPAATHADLVALARARPGALNFGSAGIGSGPHLFWESWRRAAGVEMLHVPYRGTGPALQGMLAGEVQLMIGNYGVFRGPHEGGLVRVLAISSRARHPALPDVPTVRETGTDWSEVGFNGVVAPARIPPDRRRRLEEAFRVVMAEQAMAQRLTALGSVVDFAPGAALDQRMRAERESWTRLVAAANIRVE